MTRNEPPPYRRAMIVCTAGGITAAMLRELITRGDPQAAALAAPDWELHELATGHWPMFSNRWSLPTSCAATPRLAR